MKTSRRTVKRVGWAAAVATGLLATSVGTAVVAASVHTAADSAAQATASRAWHYVWLFKRGAKIGRFQDVAAR